ncbi:MAG: gamma-glutamyltransferase [Bacillota bacterium]
MRFRKRIIKKLSVWALVLLFTLTFSVHVNADTVNPQNTTKNAMVAAADPRASHAGLEMLLKGGNAMDAAVATAFALGVVEPNASGLGGGGFLLYYDAETEEVTVLDYREVAPKAAEPDMYEDSDLPEDAQTAGILSTGIPGQVAGLIGGLEKLGTLDRETVMQPAIDYAEDGIVVSEQLSGIIEDNRDNFLKYESAARDIYLKDGVNPYEPGDVLKQKELAETLKEVAEKGEEGFYKGRVADAIVDFMEEKDGLITHEDLEWYMENRPRELEPVKGDYKGYNIYSMPPPSSGGIHIVQMLNILENFDLEEDPDHPDNLHLLTEIQKLAFADRAKYLGDTDFVDAPLEGLMSEEYAAELAERIDMDQPMLEPEAGNPFEYQEGSRDEFEDQFAYTDQENEESISTTHFSIIDEEGNMVAATNTINYFFGSKLVNPEIGVKLNNELADFTPVAGEPNSPEPLKSPLSSMSPTLIEDPEGRPFMTVGTPGATRIFPVVKQVFVNMVDYDMDIQEAIERPRVYSSGVEMHAEGRFPYSLIKQMEERGHAVEIHDDWAPFFGATQGIYIDYDNDNLVGGADPRRAGRAIGY